MAIFERPDVTIDELIGSFFGLTDSGDAESAAADTNSTSARDNFAEDRDGALEVDGPSSARSEVEPLQVVVNGHTWIIGG